MYVALYCIVYINKMISSPEDWAAWRIGPSNFPHCWADKGLHCQVLDRSQDKQGRRLRHEKYLVIPLNFFFCKLYLVTITVFFDIGCATSGVKTQLSGMRRDLDNQSWNTLETWAATAQMVGFKSHDCKQMVPTSHGNWSKKSSTHFYCYSTARM